MQYYFVTKKDNQFQLSKEDFHHIKNVMRLKEKDQFVCIYDKKNYLCTIHYVKDSYFIEVLQEILTTKELPLSIELYQAVIKNDKMDWVIQKATEIGVSAIIPLVTKRCVVKVETAKQDAKLVRYQKIIKEACEQSHRSTMPTLSSFTNLDDLVLKKDTLGVVAYENQKEQLDWTTLLKKHPYQKVAIVIGPEGGFEKEEIELLKQKGFLSISLGHFILRSETAALYTCSVFAHQIQNLKREE